jgi:Transposase DDE domain
VSYNRFVELMPWSLMGLLYFLNTCVGEMTGISFVDSTSLEVCHPKRAHSHKVFKGLADWGKSLVGWYFGFKLHLIVNDRGQIWAFALTEGNVDDRKTVPEMAKGLISKLCEILFKTPLLKGDGNCHGSNPSYRPFIRK